jgi:carbohydrate diacid regulator
VPGNFFTGPGSIARSYRTARTTMMVGKQRMPQQRSFSPAYCDE